MFAYDAFQPSTSIIPLVFNIT